MPKKEIAKVRAKFSVTKENEAIKQSLIKQQQTIKYRGIEFISYHRMRIDLVHPLYNLMILQIEIYFFYSNNCTIFFFNISRIYGYSLIIDEYFS